MNRWIARLVPFFSEDERGRGGCRHNLFVSQVEYCTNIVFKQRPALDRLCQRLFDFNRTIGHPQKLATIFGRKVTKAYRGALKTKIADHNLGNTPVENSAPGVSSRDRNSLDYCRPGYSSLGLLGEDDLAQVERLARPRVEGR